jgi:hypothetical protein
LKLDESCISNPKSEIRNWTDDSPRTRRVQLDCPSLNCLVQCQISDFGFEMQDSSNFKIFISSPVQVITPAPKPRDFFRTGQAGSLADESFHERAIFQANRSYSEWWRDFRYETAEFL